MRNTRAHVEDVARENGYEPIQIDGIPEGFSFKMPDLQIGEVNHPGSFIVFLPALETILTANTPDALLWIYNKHKK